jgi:endonuclease/exonuclease/phosphatase family metal-dependent hydrolase
MTSKRVFLLVLLLLNSFVFGQTPEAKKKIIKVLTFNIYHGETMKGDFNLDVIANVIRSVDPDFVALQEVDFKTERAKKYDLATELGWRTKMVPLFSKAMNFDGGEYGNGILSKYSFVQTRNVPLPYKDGNEPKIAVEALVKLPSGDQVAFISTHLNHLKDDSDRINQVNEINKVFLKNKYPTILAGDLNFEPGSTPLLILEKKWGTTYDKNNPLLTFPSSKPEKTIDYVMFFPREKWKVIKTEIIADPVASDHCAYLATIELLE